MKFSSDLWLRWAGMLMPRRRADWLSAMRAEASEISDPDERAAFAQGCFRAAALEGARSRKGLSFLARTGGGLCIVAMSLLGLSAAHQMGAEPEYFTAASLITNLCLFYIVGAALLFVSLKCLRIYTIFGVSVAALVWAYAALTAPSFDGLPLDFVLALSFEAAGLMLGLFLASVYLNLLYRPGLHDAD